MRGAEYGQAVTLRRGCFALALGKAGNRVTVRTMRTRIPKLSPQRRSDSARVRDPSAASNAPSVLTPLLFVVNRGHD
jgi:hypothetical protein